MKKKFKIIAQSILVLAGLFLAQHTSAFFDSGLGRWVNRDPIHEPGGLNLYGYVANNPLNRIDPFGLDYLNNSTGRSIIVYGNPGSGHGTGDHFIYGLQPPNGRFTGPISGWRDPENARRALANAMMDEKCIQGPRQFVPPPDSGDGQIEDVDGYVDANGVAHRLRGDDLGPRTTLTLGENGEYVVSRESLSVIGAYIRYPFR